VRPRAFGMSKITQIRAEVDKVWDKYDSTGDGSLTMEEALELLNSVELGDFVEGATAVRPLQRTMEDMEQLFKDADADNNNRLSKREFMAMYVNVISSRVKAEPKVKSYG
jgi:Ca2+-binding EF-hand superfamily protein